jgi:hypothetical protein
MIGVIPKLPVMVQPAPCFETRSVSPSRHAWGGAPLSEERHAGGASASQKIASHAPIHEPMVILAGKIGCRGHLARLGSSHTIRRNIPLGADAADTQLSLRTALRPAGMKGPVQCENGDHLELLGEPIGHAGSRVSNERVRAGAA